MLRFDWHDTDDQRDLVHRVVQALVEGDGGTAVCPSETGPYLVASVERAAPVSALLEYLQRSPDREACLVVGSREMAADLPVLLGPSGKRLALRAWPGPLTIEAPLGEPDAAWSANRGWDGRLENLFTDDESGTGDLPLWLPAHSSMSQAADILKHPLLAVPVDVDFTAADGAEGDLTRLELRPKLLLADQPPRFDQPNTVVRVGNGLPYIVREGVLPGRRVLQLAAEIVVFVCTGNTCRSPMAQAIFERMLADHFGCGLDELAARGIVVTSAGLAAWPGGTAADNARRVVRDFGGTLEDHITQGLSAELAHAADRLLVMTPDHQAAILDVWPELASRVELLGGNEAISDPVGGPLERYVECAQQIAGHLRPLVRALGDEIDDRSTEQP